MNFESPDQTSWKTEDKSPWWLRSTNYNEPSGNYNANCYMDLWGAPATADEITFNDKQGDNKPNGCHYHSNAYYCQPTLAAISH